MALELTNKPLGGQYGITGAGDSIGGKQVFTAKDGAGQAVLLCCLSRAELASCSPIIGASQHPNVLPILDKVDDQGMLAVVMPDPGVSTNFPQPEALYSIILQLIDGIRWLSQRGFVVASLGQAAVAFVDGRPVIKDYFAKSEDSSGTPNDSERSMIYAICSWALSIYPNLSKSEPELHNVLGIGASFLSSDRWESLDVLQEEVITAYKGRNRRILSANKTLAAIAVCCGIFLLVLRELSWQLINGL